MRFSTGGSWRPVTGGNVFVAQARKQLTRGIAYIDGAWRTIAVFVSPMTLAASPTFVSGGRAGPGSVTTGTTTATPTGGQAPYTYSWARVGAGSGTPTAPTAATTAFTRGTGAGETADETFRCTVTDALGATATADVDAQFFATDPTNPL